ncbi:hypothetical protein AAEX28_08465 [Lentisphaerota bacterium WC36G]|nr:hypothetical protein LJT99_11320 [Lentisphaerae bacterium WC36]
MSDSYHNFIARESTLLKPDQYKNLFLYENDELKYDFCNTCSILGIFFIQKVARMQHSLSFFQRKARLYTTLGNACHLMYERREHLMFLEVCKFLKIILFITPEIAATHRFVKKGKPKSLINGGEAFLEEQSGIFTSLEAINSDRLKLHLHRKSANLSTLKVGEFISLAVTGVPPSVS